jgi:hypothetical protein
VALNELLTTWNIALIRLYHLDHVYKCNSLILIFLFFIIILLIERTYLALETQVLADEHYVLKSWQPRDILQVLPTKKGPIFGLPQWRGPELGTGQSYNGGSLHASGLFSGLPRHQRRVIELCSGTLLRHEQTLNRQDRAWAKPEQTWPSLSNLISHRSCCLLIAQATPLRNSVSNLERDFGESRFHLIVNRYFQKYFPLKRPVQLHSVLRSLTPPRLMLSSVLFKWNHCCSGLLKIEINPPQAAHARLMLGSYSCSAQVSAQSCSWSWFWSPSLPKYRQLYAIILLRESNCETLLFSYIPL